MEKQTKNVITREFIEKELCFYNSADVRSAFTLCVGLSLLFVPLTVVIVYGLCHLLQSVFWKIVLSILIGILTSAPVWVNILSLAKRLKERKLLRNGDFVISVCRVQYKDEKAVQQHTEKFLHFVGFKEISVGNVIFDLTANGDEFYVIHYKGNTTIKLLYSLKTHELK